MATKKKVTRVTGGERTSAEKSPETTPVQPFIPTPESKKKANGLRILSGILWACAIAAQVVAIILLFRPPVNMTWIIILIAIDLVLVSAGSLLWKKSNRFDPPSKQDRFRFFMQSQLGLVAAVIAFLPLIVFVLSSKNLDKKQKGILAGIAGGALAIAGLIGYDFNPPSAEEYAEQTRRVEWLNDGTNDVYWTKSGTVYHLFDDCPYINTSRTDEIFEGTVAQARELKNITRLCSRCEKRAIEERQLDEKDYIPDGAASE